MGEFVQRVDHYEGPCQQNNTGYRLHDHKYSVFFVNFVLIRNTVENADCNRMLMGMNRGIICVSASSDRRG